MFGNGMKPVMIMKGPPGQVEEKKVGFMTEVVIQLASIVISVICVAILAFMIFEMARIFNLWLPSLLLAVVVLAIEAVILYNWNFGQQVLRRWPKIVVPVLCAIPLVVFVIIYVTLGWWIVNATFRQEIEICFGIGGIICLPVLVSFYLHNTADPSWPAPRGWVFPEQQEEPARLMFPGTSVKEGPWDGR